jgi:hypothetical protein
MDSLAFWVSIDQTNPVCSSQVPHDFADRHQTAGFEEQRLGVPPESVANL